jgi:hypothetical protein
MFMEDGFRAILRSKLKGKSPFKKVLAGKPDVKGFEGDPKRLR